MPQLTLNLSHFTDISYSWRTSRGATHNPNQIQNQNRQPTPQHRQAPSREKSSGGQIPTPHGGEGPGLLAMSGNAWPGDRTNRDGGSQGPAQEQHIPVGGFNAKETREELFRGMLQQLSIFATMSWYRPRSRFLSVYAAMYEL